MDRLVTLLAFVVASVASAQVYTWTDKDGVIHYTDDPAAVPANVRSKKTEGAEISLVTTDTPAPVAPVRRLDREERADRRAEKIANDDKLAALIKAERDWRTSFRDLNERIARLSDEIEVDQRKVEDLNGLPVSARFQCVNPYGLGWGPYVNQPSVITQGGSVVVGGSGQVGSGVTVGGSVTARSGVIVQQNLGYVTTPCVLMPNPEYERARERLELNRKALVRAQDELASLDRRASFEGVPREWRR